MKMNIMFCPCRNTSGLVSYPHKYNRCHCSYRMEVQSLTSNSFIYNIKCPVFIGDLTGQIVAPKAILFRNQVNLVVLLLILNQIIWICCTISFVLLVLGCFS